MTNVLKGETGVSKRELIIVAFALVLLGCSNDHTAIPEISPAVFNTAGTPTVAFAVPDMMCAVGCGAKVKEILSEQPGAKNVVVDFDSKTATVTVDPAKFDADAALAALVDHQFTNSTISNLTVKSGRSPPRRIEP